MRKASYTFDQRNELQSTLVMKLASKSAWTCSVFPAYSVEAQVSQVQGTRDKYFSMVKSMNQDDICGLVWARCGPVLPGAVNSHTHFRLWCMLGSFFMGPSVASAFGAVQALSLIATGQLVDWTSY